MPNEDKYLLCCENATHEDIHLLDNQSVVIGRGPNTKIKDRKLSRNQVEFQANYSKQTVTVRQLGANPSTVDGKILTQNQSTTVGPGSNVYLLYDLYPHKLLFIPKSHSPKRCPKNEVSSYGLSSEAETPSGKTAKCVEHKPKKRTLDAYFGASRIDASQSGNCAKKKAIPVEAQAEAPPASAKEQEEEDEDEDDQRVRDAEQQLEEMRRIMTKTRGVSSSGMRRSISLPLSNPSVNGFSKFGFPKVPGDEWEEYGNLAAYTCKGSIPREKIAGFDIDWTIIGTKSGKVFPVGTDDWRILYPEVVKKLRQLFEDDYKIVFFSNQKCVGNGRVKLVDFKRKIQTVIAKIGVPVQVLISTGSGIHRKPAPGMWNHLVDVGNEGLSIDVESSFYVGDAAGRPANWGTSKKKKDFASGDRLFALNIGLKFYTPEEFFLDQKPAPFSLPEFNPQALNAAAPLYSPSYAKLISDRQEVIVMMGYPASGKTNFVLRHFASKGYVHVNRDLLGSWQKCISVTQEALKRGKCVVVDNTNPDSASRKRYLECAVAARVPCRCFYMDISLEHAKHNNRYRQLTSTDKAHHQVNEMVLNAYKAKLQEPQSQEGFSEVVRVNFVPKFEDDKLEKLYHMFLLEK